MTGYARHYARFHPDTAAHERDMHALLTRWLRPHLPADTNVSILDVGCGRGYALTTLQRLGYDRGRGIEVDAGQVEFAQRRGVTAERVDDSAAYLRQQPGQYDLILLMDVLEHVPRDRRQELLSAIAGALRPGGRLLCTAPNAASALGPYWRYVDATHHTTFTAESLSYAAEAAGFAVRFVSGTEFFVRPRYLFWLPTRRALQWWLLVLARGLQRVQCCAELGFAAGRRVILSPNVLLVADKPVA